MQPAEASSVVHAAYSTAKRGTIWLVKQLDAHLCDLDRKIEDRIAKRAKARAEGDYEAIAQQQNRLGELCIEHKARLDSMLFFWVIGGASALAGWARAALRAADGSGSADQQIKEAVRREVYTLQSEFKAAHATVQDAIASLEAAGGAAATESTSSDRSSTPPSVELAVMRSEQQRLHAELRGAVVLQRWTCGVAVAGLVASVVAAACSR